MKRRVGFLVTLVAAFTLFTSPVAADGVGPTNFVSRITSIDPEVRGAEVEVIGSDSFLQVTADPGTEIEIPGYDGEPFLRIDGTGAVFRNRNSPATYLNNSRTGQADIPSDLPDGHQVDWERIATSGSVAWHDHRIHWMVDEIPETSGDGLVTEWQVPLTVDGIEAVVHGSLFHEGNLFPWPVTIAIAVLAAILVFTRGGKPRVVSGLLMIASVMALGVTAVFRANDPPGAGGSVLPLILAGLALLAAFASTAPGQRPVMFRLTSVIASAALLTGWAIPFIGAFWMPQLGTSAPENVIRILMALITGATLGAVALALMRPDTLPPQAPEAD